MCAASRGSIVTHCRIDPSGVPASGLFHCQYIGCSFHPATGVHVTPASSLRKSPGGQVVAYHAFGSLGCAGASENV